MTKLASSSSRVNPGEGGVAHLQTRGFDTRKSCPRCWRPHSHTHTHTHIACLAEELTALVGYERRPVLGQEHLAIFNPSNAEATFV